MKIRFNGTYETLDREMNLFEFLKKRGVDPKMGSIAAAVNEKLVKRSEWSAVFLKDEDQIELIHAVQGG